MVGTCVSGFFLFLIAAFNVIVLAGIVRVFREMRSGRYDDEELEEQLNKRGLMNRFLGPLARRVDTPWKIYPIGVPVRPRLRHRHRDRAARAGWLRGRGGRPAVLRDPVAADPVRGAGMSLFDTADGCFMNFAYDWAFAKPVREGLLQPDHHRPVGVRGGVHRRDRTARPAEPERAT